jgi:hypothetical protein
VPAIETSRSISLCVEVAIRCRIQLGNRAVQTIGIARRFTSRRRTCVARITCIARIACITCIAASLGL